MIPPSTPQLCAFVDIQFQRLKVRDDLGILKLVVSP